MLTCQLEYIFRTVSGSYGVSLDQILSKRRTKATVFARRVCINLTSQIIANTDLLPKYSAAELGAFLNMHYSSILHFRKQIIIDEKYSHLYNIIVNQLPSLKNSDIPDSADMWVSQYEEQIKILQSMCADLSKQLDNATKALNRERAFSRKIAYYKGQ